MALFILFIILLQGLRRVGLRKPNNIWEKKNKTAKVCVKIFARIDFRAAVFHIEILGTDFRTIS